VQEICDLVVYVLKLTFLGFDEFPESVGILFLPVDLRVELGFQFVLVFSQRPKLSAI
jgi:hypothetical protein